MNTTLENKGPGIDVIKARLKATWESGDFGQIAKHITATAEQFMGQLPLQRGMRVLDVACGTGNLAVIAARRGCTTSGVDIAANLILQARERARAEGLNIQFTEGDAEQLPYADSHFDAVVSMYGAMFAPRPDLVASEFFRVTRPGGFVAMANWTPEGFIGKMFQIFKAHLPPPPPGVPSPMLWGDEATARKRLKDFSEIRLERRIAVMRYPFGPAETVEFFRRYYGPTGRAFETLDAVARETFRKALVEFQTAHNVSGASDSTEVHAEYLQVIARR